MTTISVAQYLQFINETFRQHLPSDIIIEGEVSDFRVAQGKWVSFDLKDEEDEAVLKCFMTVWQLNVELEDGMRIQVLGYPKIYERFGSFKLNVQQVELVGEGALRRAYELLKQKLEKEGLFDMARKRSLPRFPARIGLITSRDAAAYGDFLRIINNRWGGVEIDFTHVHVQGKPAVPEILGAFEYFNNLSETQRPDALILVRGGGGLEDLHAFNDEAVARAVFQSKIPVVCGVGHERDESLCDFVADIRASTPSNAAELVVPNREEIIYEINNMSHFMEDKLRDRVANGLHIVENLTRTFGFIVSREKERVENALRILKQLDPKKILSKGYSIVKAGEKIIKKSKDLDIGQDFTVQLAEGSIEAKTLQIQK